MLEHYKIFHPKPKNAEESPAVNMGPAPTGLNQQGHTQLHKKDFELV